MFQGFLKILNIIRDRFLLKLKEWRQLSRRKKLAEPDRTGLQKYGAFTDFWVDAVVDAVWDFGVFLFNKYRVQEKLNAVKSKDFWVKSFKSGFVFFNFLKKPMRLLVLPYIVYKLLMWVIVLICFGLQFSVFFALNYWWKPLTADLEYTCLVLYILWLYFVFRGF